MKIINQKGKRKVGDKNNATLTETWLIGDYRNT